MKIGIYGGSFNPIHFGHLLCAEFIRQEMKLDKILFIPVGIPCHKPDKLLAGENRYEMVYLATKDNPYFEVLDIEVRENTPSYSINTLHKLKTLFKKAKFYEIIGEDVAKTLKTWKNINEIFSHADFIVLKREGEELEFTNPKIHIVENPIINISSTDIRERVKNKQSIRYRVPEIVREYIKKNGIYMK